MFIPDIPFMPFGGRRINSIDQCMKMITAESREENKKQDIPVSYIEYMLGLPCHHHCTESHIHITVNEAPEKITNPVQNYFMIIMEGVKTVSEWLPLASFIQKLKMAVSDLVHFG